MMHALRGHNVNRAHFRSRRRGHENGVAPIGVFLHHKGWSEGVFNLDQCGRDSSPSSRFTILRVRLRVTA